jgi:hypothetical protein
MVIAGGEGWPRHLVARHTEKGMLTVAETGRHDDDVVSRRAIILM